MLCRRNCTIPPSGGWTTSFVWYYRVGTRWAATTQVSSKIGPFKRVMVFPIFYNMAAVRHLKFKILIFGHVTVIEVVICCCVPNFIKIGSRIWPPDAHNC